MDAVTAHRDDFPDHGSQGRSDTRPKLPTTAPIVDDNERIDSPDPVREPSTVRLAVILGGLWVGSYPVSLGELNN